MTTATDWEGLLEGFSLERVVPAAPAADPGPADEVLARSLRAAGADAFLRRVGDGPLLAVVNDAHRPTDTASALRALAAVGRAAGCRPRVRALVATGSHRAGAEERAAHERAITASVELAFDGPVVWHDAHDASGLADIGGLAVSAHLARAEHVFAVGSVEPHYFAGATGAHKTVSIGVLGHEAIRRNHEAALDGRARPLALEGNPVHEGIAAMVETIVAGREVLCVNEVLVGGRVVAAAAGGPLQALRGALPAARAAFARAVARPLDLVVAEVGPPLDRDLYQADKGIKNVEAAVRDGGALVLVARCAGGVGIDRFMDVLRRSRTHAEAVALVRERGYALGDHKAVRLRALTDPVGRGVRIAICSSGIDEATARAVGAARLAAPQAAAAWAREALGPGAHRAAVVADAGNVCLEVGS